jgi:hypothetical protein
MARIFHNIVFETSVRHRDKLTLQVDGTNHAWPKA